MKPLTALLWVLALAGLILLFWGGPDYYSSRPYKAAWSLGHIVIFAIWCYLLIQHWPRLREMAFHHQSMWLLGAALLIGTLTEIIQTFFGRTLLLRDLMRDIEGVVFALVFLSPAPKMLAQTKLRILQTVILGIIIFESYPLAIAFADEIAARNQFPVLADFETRLELSRTDGEKASRTDQIFRHGKHSLKVMLTTDMYSGTGLKYFPGDWSGYEYLNFSIFNPENDSLKIICRVNDRQHALSEQRYQDRFNQSFELIQGWNDIRIPLDKIANAPANRKMNMRQIQGLTVFTVKLAQPMVIYLDYIHLSKE
jgi:VanZ family protein